MLRVLKGYQFFLLFLLLLVFISSCHKAHKSIPISTIRTDVSKAPAGSRDEQGSSFTKFVIKGSELDLLNLSHFETLSLADAADFYNLYGLVLNEAHFDDFKSKLNAEFSGQASHFPIQVTIFDENVLIDTKTFNQGTGDEYTIMTVENIVPNTKITFSMDQSILEGTEGAIKYLSFRGYKLDKIDDTNFVLVPLYYFFATRGNRFMPEIKADFSKATFNREYFHVNKQAP